MDFEGYVSHGLNFIESRNFALALENFEAALELQPDNESIGKMVEALKSQGDMLSNMPVPESTEEEDSNIAKYSEMLTRNPNDASAKGFLASSYYNRGAVFSSMGEYEKAFEDFSKAIENSPEFYRAFNKRGWVDLELGKYDQAIEDFKTVIRYQPDNEQSKYNLAAAYQDRGIMHHKKGEYADACTDFKAGLDFDKTNSTLSQLLEMAEADMVKN